MVAGVLLVALLVGPFAREDPPGTAERVSAASTTTTQEIVGTTTTAEATTATTLAATAPGVPAGEDATIASIVDGDTLRLSDGRSVRLIGVDTPETKDPRRPVQCFGEEATRYTSERLPPGTSVRLVYDVERRDSFGRDLVYVYRLPDGLFLNAHLIRDGFGQMLTVPPNVAHVASFRSLQEEARTSGRGLWSACGGTSTTQTTSRRTATTRGTTATTEGSSTVYYRNCDEARAAGAAPLPRGQPGYRSGLDRDNDGVACE